MTSYVPITRKRGDTKVEEITVIDEDTGAVKDITGATFLLSVNVDQNPVAPTVNVFQISGSITDAAGGVVEFPFSVSDADNLGDFFYDIEMTSSGLIDTIMEGSFHMDQDITK